MTLKADLIESQNRVKDLTLALNASHTENLKLRLALSANDTQRAIQARQLKFPALYPKLNKPVVTSLATDAKPRRKAVLSPTRPNVGIEASYRRAIQDLLDAMHQDFSRAIKRQYRATPPAIATDATPSKELTDLINVLAKKWRNNWDKVAQDFAEHYSKKVSDRVDGHLRHILKKHGVTIKFSMTPAQKDVLQATVTQNVSLIKSIPEQYLKSVEGHVMRAVQVGRAVGPLAKELQASYSLTKARAALIARDQVQKATSALNRARQLELDIKKGVWMHSHAGKEPRKTHVAMHGKEFDLSKGMYDSDPKVKRNVFPGELINCRCTWKPIIKGFI